MSNEILNTNPLRLRLIDLEYKDLPREEFISEVRRIYFEETGENLNLKINYLSSKDSQDLKGDESGYNGTAIHFYSEKDLIDQVYVISQGSNDKEDWNYNVTSIFAGNEASQSASTELFVAEAIDKFKEESNSSSSPLVVGLSHSLAHNNNTIAKLKKDVFDEIYSANGAQPTVYQLYQSDHKFALAVRKEFNLGGFNIGEIYALSPSELTTFGENYYAEKAEGVHQLLSLDDPLYAGSGVRGFMMLGDITMVDTNPEMSGLRSMMDNIPDEVIADFQQMAVQFADLSKTGGAAEGLKGLTGIDLKVVEELAGRNVLGQLQYYFTNSKELDDMIVSVNEKLPPLLESVQNITANRESIFGAFVDNNFISEAEKEVLVTEIGNLEQLLDEAMGIVNSTSMYRDSEIAGNTGTAIFGNDIAAVVQFLDISKEFTKSQEAILEILGPLIEEIGHSHSIEEMLNALGAENNRQYLGNDMIVVGEQEGQEVKVNISAAVRMYQEGTSLLEEKRNAVLTIMETHEKELLNAFDEEKAKVLSAINDLEQNPSSYQYYLSQAGVYGPRGQTKLTRISVHESFQSLTGVSFTELQGSLFATIQRTEDFLQSSREAIEIIFEEDEIVAKLFNNTISEGDKDHALR